jgi:hypothetical protein
MQQLWVCRPGPNVTFDRVSSTTSVIDVLEHVFDKGIVLDAWVCVSATGIDLRAIEARIVVASIATYLSRAEAPDGRPSTTTRSERQRLM